MSTSLLVFLGMHLLSLLTAWMLIMEHRRLCKEQELIFAGLNDGGRRKRERSRYMLVILYLLTTVAIIAMTIGVLPPHSGL